MKQKAVANEAKAASSGRRTSRSEQEAMPSSATKSKPSPTSSLAKEQAASANALCGPHEPGPARLGAAGGAERVSELLEQHRPKPGETDLRGFEWHYLNRLCHAELLTLKDDWRRMWPTARTASAWPSRLTTGEGVGCADRPGALRPQGACRVAFSPAARRLASRSTGDDRRK